MGPDAVTTAPRTVMAPVMAMAMATVTEGLVVPVARADLVPDRRVPAAASEVASEALPTTAASSACEGRCASSPTSSS